MTTGLMRPPEESQNTVRRQNYPVFMLEIGHISFLLFLVDRDRFQTFFHAFVDISKLLQLLNLLESI